MKKKLPLLVLLALLLCALMPATASATTYRGTTGPLSWMYEDDNNTLTISGNGDMPDYTSASAQPWHEYADEIGSVYILPGVTRIGENAFKNCTELESINWYASMCKVRSIGDYAFQNCDSLISVTLPKSIDYMGNGVFSNCDKLLVFRLPVESEMNEIPGNTFANCTALTTVDLGGSNNTTLLSIGGMAFQGCSALETIDLPNTVRRIEFRAFEDCTSLSSIVMPVNLTTVEEAAFKGCTGLESIEFTGKSPTFEKSHNGSGGFFYANFEGVTAIAFYPAGVPSWNAETLLNYGGNLTWQQKSSYIEGEWGDLEWSLNTGSGYMCFYGTGAMQEADNKEDYPWYPYIESNTIKQVKVNHGITTIANHAFTNCHTLSQISLPETLTTIGAYAFYATPLTNVTIPSSVTAINTSAFMYCRNLVTVGFANGSNLKKIHGDAFSCCSALANITLPESVENIGSGAFQSCTSLTSMTIGKNVATLEGATFSGCTSLTTITFKGNAPSMGTNLFNGVMATARYPHGNSTWTDSKRQQYGGDITWEAYDLVLSGQCGINADWSLSTANGILTISGIGSTYDYNSNTQPWADYRPVVNHVNVQSGITGLGAGNFAACDALTSVSLPANFTTLGASCFSGCSGLTSVSIPASVETIPLNCFINCSKLRNVAFVSGTVVKTLGEGAFQNCTGLETFSIPNGLTTIAKDAFKGCTALESISIPASVTTFGQTAFQNCTALSTIRFGGNAPSHGGNGFDGVTATAWIPAANTTWTTTVKNNFGGTITWNESYDHLNGQCGDNMTYWFEPSTGLLTIQGSGTMWDYNSDTNRAPWSYWTVNEVRIANGPESIGDYAFYETPISNIMMNDSITSIGQSAFSGCKSLTGVSLSSNLTSVGRCAFWFCTNLRQVSFRGDSLYTIPEYCFSGCSSLEEIILGQNIGRIGSMAFMDCSSLEHVWLDASARLGYIDSYAFKNCTSLKTFEFPGNLLSIDNQAFCGCDALNLVTFDSAAPAINAAAFKDTTTVAYYNPNNTGWTDDVLQGYGGNIWWNSTLSDTTRVGICGDDLYYVLTSTGNLRINGSGSMWDYHYTWPSVLVKSVTVQNGVKGIGAWAFRDCTRLTSVSIPDSVTSIGSGAFRSCEQLASIELPAGLTSLGATAFNGCVALESITIPEGVAYIGEGTFGLCDSLSSITFVGDAPAFSNMAFFGTTATAQYYVNRSGWTVDVMQDYGGTITWMGTEQTDHGPWGPHVSWNYNFATHVLTISGYGAMNDFPIDAPWAKYADEIQEIVMDDGITTICHDAFADCDDVASITLPSALTSIGAGAFSDCSSIKSIDIPAGVTSIGENAFEFCFLLRDVTFNGNAPAIGDDAFKVVVADVRYPAYNDTYTEDNMLDYGGQLTWDDGKIDIFDATVAPLPSMTYTGTVCEPNLTVTYAGKTLTRDVDYTVTYTDNKDAGMAKVTVSGTGEYSHKKDVTFTIEPAPLTVSVADETIVEGDTPTVSYEFDGFVNGETPETAASFVYPTVVIPYPLEAGQSYQLIPEGGSAFNYTLSYQAGTLTVVGSMVTRLYGTYANQTSAAISGEAFEDGGSSWAIVACDDGFADAMSASGLAGTLHCPILLSNYQELSDSTRDEIIRLGVNYVYLIGGKYAMTEDVEAALNEIPGVVSVERIWGTYSWDTSVECAKKIADHGGNPSEFVIVAQSGNFQDALSMSPFAYSNKVPILLEQGKAQNWMLPDDAVDLINGLTGTIYVAGGPYAVGTDSVEDVFGDARVERLYGTTGYDTSNVIATYLIDEGMAAADTVCIAYGGLDCNGVDALSGGALAGLDGGVMLLVDNWTSPELVQTIEGTDSAGNPGFLTANADDVKHCYILGGKYVVPVDFFAHVRDDVLHSIGVDPFAAA